MWALGGCMKDKRNSVPVTLKKRLNRVLISDITFDMIIILQRSFKELLVLSSTGLVAAQVFPHVVIYTNDIHALLGQEARRWRTD
jgi:hypothetical protein